MSPGQRDISGHRIVITGATNGIGKEIARDLIRRGAALTLIARNPAKAAATVDELMLEPGAAFRPDVVVADISRPADVRRAADELHERLDAIDVLVNNAGIHQLSSNLTPDGLDAMMSTNHLGPFLLTNLVLDLLESAAPSRIVMTASEAHRVAPRPDLARLTDPGEFGLVGAELRYGQSKLLNILFAQELARRIEGSGVTVNAFCPGLNATNLVENKLVLRGGDLLARTGLVRTPEIGARMGIRLVVDPALEGVSGQFFTSTPGLRFLPTVPARRDRAYQEEMWRASAAAVGL
ncbi:MAG TPA: SDR family NAD(P)-dependent oxidoreductase [Nocardioidaceae bacterium]|nr:SDR family NAD(P)-dependent oxidoreductase [Nocardioidaceae bacterium]